MYIGKDKIIHAAVCMAAVIIAGLATCWISVGASIGFGMGLAIGLGFGKEYGDSKATGDKWSWGDIVADLAGTAIGGTFMVLLFVITKAG